MTPEVFSFTLEESSTIQRDLLRVSGTTQAKRLEGQHQSSQLQRERRQAQLHLEHQAFPLMVERATCRYHFDRLGAEGLERVLVRSLRRSRTLIVALSDIVGLFYHYGQVVTFAQVPVILAAARKVRFGQCAPHRWTLLPWERLQVDWSEESTPVMSVPEYVRLATHFWVTHAYVPGPAEEPNARVRSVVERSVGSLLDFSFLIPADQGPFELEVDGVRKRYRVDAQALPDGKLGNIWIWGRRMTVHISGQRITGVDRLGNRSNLTESADEVMVRLVGLFQDPVYQAERNELGNRIYRALRKHRLKLRFNER